MCNNFELKLGINLDWIRMTNDVTNDIAFHILRNIKALWKYVSKNRDSFLVNSITKRAIEKGVFYGQDKKEITFTLILLLRLHHGALLLLHLR